jgi:hypothetical protein
MTLASILVDRRSPLEVNALLAHDPIRDYCDRWMDESFMTKLYQDSGRTFLEEMKHYNSALAHAAVKHAQQRAAS